MKATKLMRGESSRRSKVAQHEALQRRIEVLKLVICH